ncbi:nucleobase-ascorbate transporter 11 isoform X2 [Eucalyptus grandis]|uniref:nucleobase-ascorbate transporter 11 isoform X2 n=1 Tax=Eucalyptus grandis TaxID=71139 RepID=UPI00192EA691|nr:nucleobase-ascorbate transporter 11 isoform X2 [Eucalyptus grandis]
MEAGSSSKNVGKAEGKVGGRRLGSMFSKIDPFVGRTDHNPRELRSWAKKTGFVSTFSGETNRSSSAKFDSGGFDLERDADRRGGGSSPKIEIDPVLGRTRRDSGVEIEPASVAGSGVSRDGNGGILGARNGALRGESQRVRVADEASLRDKEDKRKVGANGNGNLEGGNTRSENSNQNNGNGRGVAAVAPGVEMNKDDRKEEGDVRIDVYPEGEEPENGWWNRSPGMRLGLRDNPGFVPIIYYSLQHYLSLAGSLIFIPLIMVPTMGGSDKDTATVISTMLLVSGITTLLNSYFGTRLPLVQGSSFVFLAPALVIMNSREYRNLAEHRFRHIMRELQGAIIVGSIFQSFLGFTGLISLLIRLINPVVVAPTVAAVGLAFFSYGFPQAGSCVEIGIPLILLVLIFSLYLRGISIFGHRLFQIYAIGTYHSASVLVNLKPPSPGIVSRGIALEGFCSLLAGLWGSASGSTTLTENLHTIRITKVANRRVVEVGAVFLIFFSFIGKVGAILASIPQALAASILCFIWALIVALGLSTLQYTQTASFRNMIIVGVSLFLGLSIPAYFQQYQPEASLMLPGYLIPYAAASDGPVNSGSSQLDFAINALMSLNMVVTLLVAIVLDTTVPGNRQERGVYIWSQRDDIAADPSSLADYSLPRKVARIFCCSRCLTA